MTKKNNKAVKRTHKKISKYAVLRVLKEKGRALKTQQIADAFSVVNAQGLDQIERALEHLYHTQQIARVGKHKWSSIEEPQTQQGRVVGHAEGHGYVFLEDGESKVYISKQQMRSLLHNDVVSFTTQKRGRFNKTFAQIVAVLRENEENIVGRFYSESRMNFVVPESPQFSHDIYIAAEHTLGAKNGQVVLVKITQRPTDYSHPVGEVIEVMGEYDAPGMEKAIALRKHNLPHTWNEKVVEETRVLDVNQIHYGEQSEQGLVREDCRHIPFVTIDGEDAKDFDDAVYCEVQDNGNWTLMVAIADVSYYVKPNSAIDKEAYHRGNSVYFPNEVIPMLPTILSNELCSLKPEVDRFCMVCEMTISPQGAIKKYTFYPAIMHSHARLTYNQVFQYLQAEQENTVPASMQMQVDKLHLLSSILLQARRKCGAIELDIAEAALLFDANLKIASIQTKQRNQAHRMIEECMLAANICASLMLDDSDLVGIYRVHEAPEDKKIEELSVFLRQFKYLLNTKREISSQEYTHIITQFKGDALQEKIIKNALLRSMKQAVYSAENHGHFALNFDSYTHFTSPIRRYSDLIVHRQIKRLLIDKHSQDTSEAKTHMEDVAHHISTTERKAEAASRDVIQWLKCEYMSHRLGDVFNGVVVAVTDFGVFVELEAIFIEGLVHVTELGEDYYRFDEQRKCLLGESTGEIYHIGKQCRVSLARVDMQQARIDLRIIQPITGKRKSNKQARKRAKKNRS